MWLIKSCYVFRGSEGYFLEWESKGGKGGEEVKLTITETAQEYRVQEGRVIISERRKARE